MVAIVEKVCRFVVYLRYMETIISNLNRFEKVGIKKRIFNFSINHEKNINNSLKQFEKSGTLPTIKAVGCRPGTLHGLYKVHKAIADVFQPFRYIFSAIRTPSTGSPLGPTMGNVLLPFYEIKWLEQCQKNSNQFFTEDTLITFLFSSSRLNTSQNFVVSLILVIHTNLFLLNKKKYVVIS